MDLSYSYTIGAPKQTIPKPSVLQNSCSVTCAVETDPSTTYAWWTDATSFEIFEDDPGILGAIGYSIVYNVIIRTQSPSPCSESFTTSVTLINPCQSTTIVAHTIAD